MIRVLALSLLMLFTIAVTLPVAESHAGRGNGKASWQKRSKKMTRRQRQAYYRRRRAALRRRRQLARLRRQEVMKMGSVAIKTSTTLSPTGSVRPAVLTGAPHIATPAGWNGGGAANGEVRWQVSLAATAGTANVTFASLGAAGTDDNRPSNRRFRTLGGHAHANLRRQVIDRMIAEGGWVTNDTERTIGGHPTFVVHAASGNQSASRHWKFYYTVVGDRLYRFVFDAPGVHADRLAVEIEAVVASLRAPASAPLTARRQQLQ